MPIQIIIKSEGAEDVKDANNPLTPNDSKKKEDEKVEGKMSKEMALVTKFAISQAKTWSMEIMKTQSNFTGNTQFQKNVDFTLSAIDNVALVWAGFKVGGGYGVAIAMASIVAKQGIQEYNTFMEVKTHNRDLSLLRQGQGQRSINGGRYGV